MRSRRIVWTVLVFFLLSCPRLIAADVAEPKAPAEPDTLDGLQIVIEPTKPVFAPGDTCEFRVSLTNVGDKDLVLNLGTMLANGVPILQTLAIAKDATGSALLAEAIEKAAESVRAGERLADPLKASGLFPLEVIEMIAVAEESNQLEKVLVEIANTVERRTNRQVDMAVRLIEPAILLVMAGGIAFVAVGLYYPILTMASTLK